jgi:hypothetical protein
VDKVSTIFGESIILGEISFKIPEDLTQLLNCFALGIFLILFYMKSVSHVTGLAIKLT